MSNLLEVVFENVCTRNVGQLLLSLIAGAGRIVNAQCSEDIRLIVSGELDANALNFVLKFQGDVNLSINIGDLEFGGVILPNVLLRLVKYGEQYDIDLNFDPYELENVDMMGLVKQLHDHAKEIARDSGVDTFFGGMEPASDKDTRYFTNDDFGPLLI
jgi:hypothetical protein